MLTLVDLLKVVTVSLVAASCAISMSRETHGQEASARLRGFSLDNPHVSRASGFTYAGDADNLVNAIEKGLLATEAKNVERVRLEQHKVSSRELLAVASLPNVQHLILGVSPDPVELDQAAIDTLKEFGKLTELEIYANTQPGVSWKPLASLAKLEVLSLGGDFALGDTDLQALADLRYLINLVLDARLECDNFEWLASMKRLQTLRLHEDTLDVSIFAAISKLRQLEVLTLFTRNGFKQPAEHIEP